MLVKFREVQILSSMMYSMICDCSELCLAICGPIRLSQQPGIAGVRKSSSHVPVPEIRRGWLKTAMSALCHLGFHIGGILRRLVKLLYSPVVTLVQFKWAVAEPRNWLIISHNGSAPYIYSVTFYFADSKFLLLFSRCEH